ncbi:hypothetical protein KC347_g297 [Hortaea werneckii]|nr:hypothetical protein KC347_g297 [Hortaea werneckii]
MAQTAPACRETHRYDVDATIEKCRGTVALSATIHNLHIIERYFKRMLRMNRLPVKASEMVASLHLIVATLTRIHNRIAPCGNLFGNKKTLSTSGTKSNHITPYQL